MKDQFYLLSKHESQPPGLCMWWRPKRAGYTPILDDAGVYGREEAEDLLTASPNPDRLAGRPFAAVEQASQAVTKELAAACVRRPQPPPPLVRSVHGIPRRMDRIAALGNAVVPQVAEWIGRRIVEAAS